MWGNPTLLNLMEKYLEKIINNWLWKARKFNIRKNNKVDSIETWCRAIVHLLTGNDLEKCMYTTLF